VGTIGAEGSGCAGTGTMTAWATTNGELGCGATITEDEGAEGALLEGAGRTDTGSGAWTGDAAERATGAGFAGTRGAPASPGLPGPIARDTSASSEAMTFWTPSGSRGAPGVRMRSASSIARSSEVAAASSTTSASRMSASLMLSAFEVRFGNRIMCETGPGELDGRRAKRIRAHGQLPFAPERVELCARRIRVPGGPSPVVSEPW